jgi:hypothetical protein
LKNNSLSKMDTGEILIYQISKGIIKIDVRLEKDILWFTQCQLATLFRKACSTIAKHIHNVFKEGELIEKVVCRYFRLTPLHREGIKDLKKLKS